MLPDVRPTRALMLGYGAGTLAHLLHQRFGPVPIVAVDDDPRVLALAPALLPPLPGVEMACMDALQYVSGTRDRFDYAALDLFRGGATPPGTFSRPFLRRLRGILAPGAVLVANLFLDGRSANRVQALGRIFRVREERRVGHNVVVHCKT
jgi:spermidine synthase